MTSADLFVSGVHEPRSLGVRRYVGRLATALAELGFDYRPAAAPSRGSSSHFHLANSSRRVAVQAPLARAGFLVTVHDVIPRTSALRHLYRSVVYPLCVRRASMVVVHSQFAAELLVYRSGIDRSCLAVVPHPASAPTCFLDAAAARRELGLDRDGAPLFVLPGVIKRAKLVSQVIEASAPLVRAGEARVLLAGRVADHAAATRARELGIDVICDPDDATYEAAIMAADAIFCLRGASVGETNGPLLDAIGAEKPIIATRSGSIPEVAEEAALYIDCDPTPTHIAKAMHSLLDPPVRAGLAAAARRRASGLTWRESAVRHLELLELLA